MEQKTLELNGVTYRVKKMNAIEALALRTAGDIDTPEHAQRFFNEILERIELNVGNKWLPVKEKGQSVYYPAGVEDDIDTINALVSFFMNDYLKPLFTKSAE